MPREQKLEQKSKGQMSGHWSAPRGHWSSRVRDGQSSVQFTEMGDYSSRRGLRETAAAAATWQRRAADGRLASKSVYPNSPPANGWQVVKTSPAAHGEATARRNASGRLSDGGRDPTFTPADLCSPPRKLLSRTAAF